MFPLMQTGWSGSWPGPQADRAGLRPDHLRRLRRLRRRPRIHRRDAGTRDQRHALPPPVRRGAAGPRPTVEDPFTVVLIDEVAFLTTYQPNRNLGPDHGRAGHPRHPRGAVGYCVVAALQDPRKDVLTIRTCSRTGSPCGSMSRSRSTWFWGRRPGPRRHLRADIPRPGCRRRGGVRPARSRPGPGAGPRRMGRRRRHPGPG